MLNNPKTNGYTAVEVAQRIGANPNYTRTTLKNLTEKGQLQRHCFLVGNKKTAKFFDKAQNSSQLVEQVDLEKGEGIKLFK